MSRADVAAIRAALDALCAPDAVYELRVPNVEGRKRTDSGYYKDLDQLAAAAARYSGRVPGVYVTLNPCADALFSRAANRVQTWAKLTTTDEQIARRLWLLIDADPIRPAGVSSTDAEHAAAIERVYAIREWLALQGWPDPLVADSGNGGHLLYRVELPNTDESTALVKGVLTAVAAHFSDATVAIDTSVYNAARIVKLYGTRTCKGDHTAERPHRVARILEGGA